MLLGRTIPLLAVIALTVTPPTSIQAQATPVQATDLDLGYLAPESPQQDDLAPTVTRYRVLNIPFELHSAKEQTREVQLLVSNDGGISWNVEKVATPGEAAFEFAAKADGEYWFSVRTIDRLGNMTPEGTPKPEAKLIIDSTPPHLQLQAEIDAEDRLSARWVTDDPRLQEGSLQIEYRAVGDTEWLPFPLDPLDAEPGNSTSGGHLSWLPPVDGQWEMRALVADTAGNQATVVQAAQTAAAKAQSNPAMHSAIAGEAPTQTPQLPPRNTNLQQPGMSPGVYPNNAFSPGSIPPGAPPPLYPNPSRNALSTNNAGLGNSQLGNVADSGPERNDSLNQNWSAANSRRDAQPQASVRPTPISDPAASSELAAQPQNPFGEFGGRTPARPIGLTRDGDRELEPRQIVPNVAAIKPDEPMLYVNSLRFALDFDAKPASVALDAADAVRAVEMWGTADGGQTWRRYASGRSHDGQLLIEVANPGRYGFKLVEIDRAALQLPPRSGDRPEVWVVVDRTVPVCQLLNATQGDDEHLDELTITWSASDEQLTDAAVTLQYGQTPTGPWQTIVQGAENTGSYLWRMGSHVPIRFHLRLLVQDMAGNFGEYVSRVPVEPIRRDFGRITGVRAVDSFSGQATDGSFHSAQRNQ